MGITNKDWADMSLKAAAKRLRKAAEAAEKADLPRMDKFIEEAQDYIGRYQYWIARKDEKYNA